MPKAKIRLWLKRTLLAVFGGAAVVGLILIVSEALGGDARGLQALGTVYGTLFGNAVLAGVVFGVLALGFWLWDKRR